MYIVSVHEYHIQYMYINTYKEPCTVNRPRVLPFPCLEGLTMLTCIMYTCTYTVHCIICIYPCTP